MSYYSRECEGFDWLYAGVPAELTPVKLPTLRIVCSACGAHRRIPITYFAMVTAQIDLWREGWRRDPATGRDYCPEHTPV